MSEEPTIIEFFVPGTPQQKGSKTAIPRRDKKTGRYMLDFKGRPIIDTIDSNRKSPKWMRHVRDRAKEAITCAPLRGPLKFSARFYFSRLLAQYHRRKSGDVLRQDAPHFKSTSPDLGKLVRAIEDAIQGVAYINDSQIAQYGRIEKVYTERVEGVLIRVETIVDPGPQPNLCRSPREATLFEK